jgi:hypothetical protein
MEDVEDVKKGFIIIDRKKSKKRGVQKYVFYVCNVCSSSIDGAFTRRLCYFATSTMSATSAPYQIRRSFFQ